MLRADRRIRACLLGGAIGDALGMPFERVTSARIKSLYKLPLRDFVDPVEGAPCCEFGLRRGNYTDDTQSTRVSMIAITENNVASPRVIAEALAAWLYQHSLGQEPRYPGQTTRKAMRRFLETNDVENCGCETPSCGAAIRIAPVAIWAASFSESDFVECITDAANITHTGQTAVDGALVVASMIKTGMRNMTPPVDAVASYCKSRRMIQALRKVKHALECDVSADDLVQDLGGQTGAHEVVPLAIFQLYKNKFKFKPTLLSGLNTFHPSGIDMDSVLSIAGAVSGVRDPVGVERSTWIRRVEDAKLISEETRRFIRVLRATGKLRRQ
jgi:ADP-ribosylglycohydrolase